jgi:hypothetical protein
MDPFIEFVSFFPPWFFLAPDRVEASPKRHSAKIVRLPNKEFGISTSPQPPTLELSRPSIRSGFASNLLKTTRKHGFRSYWRGEEFLCAFILYLFSSHLDRQDLDYDSLEDTDWQSWVNPTPGVLSMIISLTKWTRETTSLVSEIARGRLQHGRT